MADANTDDAVEVKGEALTLDQVNDLTQAKLAKEEQQSDDGATVPDDDTADAEQTDSDADDAADAPDTPDAQPPPPPPAKEEDKPAAQLTPEPKTVEILGADGKRHKFTSVDDVPNDFEPASYKELMVAVSKLTRMELDTEAAAKKAEDDRIQAEQQSRIQAIHDGWARDEAKLLEAGVLPSDGRERKGVVNEVYNYMEEQLKQGVVIDSFEEAFKSVQYDKFTAERDAAQTARNEAKKQRGGMVQAGGTPAPNKPTIREGLPPGLSLDAVHAKVLSQL